MKTCKKYLRQIPVMLICILAVSCENAPFLDAVPYSETMPENFYKTESDMRMALISCYEAINTHKIPGNSTARRGSYDQGVLYIMNAPSDDVVAATSSSDEGLEMKWGNYNESTRCIREFWKVFYAGINRCNIVLEYIGKSDVPQDKQPLYIAEARFMRAFFYYHLAWNFGGVPIVTSYASNGQEPRSSLQEVYKFIFEDLEYACNTLGTTGLITNISATKYTAAAYTGRICNYLAACKTYGTGQELVAEQPLNDFAWVDAAAMTRKAKEALEPVVNQSPYTLIDDYTALFRETTKTEQYRECLMLSEVPLASSEGYWPLSFYLPSPQSSGSVTPVVYGGRFVPTPRAFYMYHPHDMRRDHNMTGRISDGEIPVQIGGYTYLNPNPPKQTVKIQVLDDEGNPVTDPATGQPLTETIVHPLYDNLETQTYLPVSGIQVCPGKVRLAAIDQMSHTHQQHSFSFPLMRMADVVLMYAEALYFSGDEAGARVQMDKVLERASTSPENYALLKNFYRRDDFVEELLESRQRELIFECSRKWDLIRFNRITQAIGSLDAERVVEKLEEFGGDDKYLRFQTGGYLQLAVPTLKQNWEPHKIWLPISEEQRGVNKNLTQNAGWGS